VGTVLRVGPLLGPIDVIDGRTFSDDTYLAATVAQNIGWGRGPLYGDEPTNGYQPLHVLLAATTWTGDDAAVRAAPTRDLLDRRIKQQAGIAVAFDLLAILLIAGLLSTRYGPGPEALLGAAIWALHPTPVRVALNGLETSIAAALVLAALLVWKARGDSLRWRGVLGVLLGLGALARIDVLILIACLGVADLAASRGSLALRRLAVVGIAAAAVYLPYLAWSYGWTGLLFPISGRAVRLNALSWEARHNLGLLFWLRSAGSCLGSIVKYNGPVLFTSCIVGLAMAWRSRRAGGAWGATVLRELGSWRVSLSFVAALYLAYSFWVLAWWFNHRYLFIALLVPILAGAAALRVLKPRVRLRVTAVVALLCLVHPGHWGLWSEPDLDLGYRNLGLWANERFEPGTRIGSCQTGALHYYATQLSVHNLDGVVSASALQALEDERAIPHAQDLGLEYLVAWRACINYLAQRSAGDEAGVLQQIEHVQGFRSWHAGWRVYSVEPAR
jgi:hypothetical protein